MASGASPAQVHSRWQRLDGIDCLRALAIFYVLLNHINMRLLGADIAYTHGLPRQLVTSLVWEGQAGVQIFFAVSGFLITATSIRRWGTLAQVNLRDFYLIRFARIAPLLLTLLAVLSVLHLLQVNHYVVSQKDGGLPNALFAALTLRTGLLEATRGYLPGNWDILWSLSVEELFYLFFPMACRLLHREKHRGGWLILLLLCFVVLGPFARTMFTEGNPVWREYSYLGGMDAIALGCLTALFTADRKISRRSLVMLTGCGLALLFFCLALDEQPSARVCSSPWLHRRAGRSPESFLRCSLTDAAVTRSTSRTCSSSFSVLTSSKNAEGSCTLFQCSLLEQFCWLAFSEKA